MRTSGLRIARMGCRFWWGSGCGLSWTGGGTFGVGGEVRGDWGGGRGLVSGDRPVGFWIVLHSFVVLSRGYRYFGVLQR